MKFRVLHEKEFFLAILHEKLENPVYPTLLREALRVYQSSRVSRHPVGVSGPGSVHIHSRVTGHVYGRSWTIHGAPELVHGGVAEGGPGPIAAVPRRNVLTIIKLALS